jgi:hypothetical protein
MSASTRALFGSDRWRSWGCCLPPALQWESSPCPVIFYHPIGGIDPSVSNSLVHVSVGHPGIHACHQDLPWEFRGHVYPANPGVDVRSTRSVLVRWCRHASWGCLPATDPAVGVLNPYPAILTIHHHGADIRSTQPQPVPVPFADPHVRWSSWGSCLPWSPARVRPIDPSRHLAGALICLSSWVPACYWSGTYLHPSSIRFAHPSVFLGFPSAMGV